MEMLEDTEKSSRWGQLQQGQDGSKGGQAGLRLCPDQLVALDQLVDHLWLYQDPQPLGALMTSSVNGHGEHCFRGMLGGWSVLTWVKHCTLEHGTTSHLRSELPHMCLLHAPQRPF